MRDFFFFPPFVYFVVTLPLPPLPPDMKVTRRTDVISLVEHMRKKLEPIVDLSDLDTRDAPEA